MTYQTSAQLPTELITSKLAPEEIPQAFALVQFAAPDASFPGWCNFAQEILRDTDRRQRGFLTVRDSRDVILGIDGRTVVASIGRHKGTHALGQWQ